MCDWILVSETCTYPEKPCVVTLEVNAVPILYAGCSFPLKAGFSPYGGTKESYDFTENRLKP